MKRKTMKRRHKSLFLNFASTVKYIIKLSYKSLTKWLACHGVWEPLSRVVCQQASRWSLRVVPHTLKAEKLLWALVIQNF